MCACMRGGIRWELAGWKWRTQRFGYEKLESFEGMRERKKEYRRTKTKIGVRESMVAGGLQLGKNLNNRETIKNRD